MLIGTAYFKMCNVKIGNVNLLLFSKNIFEKLNTSREC